MREGPGAQVDAAFGAVDETVGLERGPALRAEFFVRFVGREARENEVEAFAVAAVLVEEILEPRRGLADALDLGAARVVGARGPEEAPHGRLPREMAGGGVQVLVLNDPAELPAEPAVDPERLVELHGLEWGCELGPDRGQEGVTQLGGGFLDGRLDSVHTDPHAAKVG